MLKGMRSYGVVDNGGKTNAIKRGADTSKRSVVTASLGNAAGGGAGGQVSGVTSMRGSYELGVMDGTIDLSNRRMIMSLCRDMFMFDTISGSAIELMSNLPFSSFTLSGVNDKKILQTFIKSCENLRLNKFFPSMAIEYLTDGAHQSTLEWNQSEEIFKSIISHNGLDVELTELPTFGSDPLLTLKMSESMKKLVLLAEKDPRVKKAIDNLPALFRNVASGKGGKKGGTDDIMLEPSSTVYIARQTYSWKSSGTSYLHRIIPIWLMEKAFIRGTTESVYQRQRPIIHVTAGDGVEYEPNDAELSQITELIKGASMDPIGAIIATRPDININEIIRGDDFWKWTDINDQLAAAKLKALGISDSFLCMSGESLITTKEHGLVKIKDMVDHKRRSVEISKPEKLKNTHVNSHGGVGTAANWVYSGIKQTLKIKSKKGYGVTCTPEHRVMVLRNLRHEWVTASEVKSGDYLCIPTNEVVRTTPLPLSKSLGKTVGSYQAPDKVDISYPEYMTPDLAFAVGLLVSEGCFTDYSVRFSNSSNKLIERYVQCMEDVFGVSPIKQKPKPAGQSCTINGVETASTKPCWPVEKSSKALCRTLAALGLHKTVNGLGRKNSYLKTIPWSIMEADEQSQLAFIAAYVEGDGTVCRESGKQSIVIYSKSKLLLKQMQVMLLAHGIVSQTKGKALRINNRFATTLMTKMKKFMVDKGHDFAVSRLRHDGFGIPAEQIYKELNVIGATERGSTLANDKLGEIFINGWAQAANHLNETMYYCRKYELLDHIKKVSPETYGKISLLNDYRYLYDKVATVKKYKKIKTYDLMMAANGQRAFTANGVVVHNSGDANFSTIEVSLSTFMEQLKAFREMTTREFFYEKMFPSIAVACDFKKSKRDMKVTSEAELASPYEDGRGGYVKTRRRNGQEEFVAICDGSSVADISKIKDITEFYIPTVEWHKQLGPTADTNYMDVLQSLTEKGVPVPIRTIAAAGGMDIDKLMSQMDDDMELRQDLSGHMKKIKKLLGEDGGFGEMGGFGDSMQARKARKSRNFRETGDTERYRVRELDSRGKTRYATPRYQKQLEERINRETVKALARIADGSVPRPSAKRVARNSPYGKTR